MSLQQRLLNALRPHGWVVDRTTLTRTHLTKYNDELVSVGMGWIPSDFAELTDVERRTLEKLLDANAPVEKLLEVFGVQ